MEHKLHKKGHLLSKKEKLIEIFTVDLNSEHLESNSTKKMAFKHLRNIDDKIYIVMEDFSNGSQRPRIDLDKRFLPRPNTTTA